MTLWTKNGCYPQAMPFQDVDADFNTWTNLATNEAGREACGWAEAPDAPAYDPEAESLSWADGAWLVTPFSAEQLAAQLDTARQARLAELATLRWAQMQTAQFNGQAMPADDITVGRCVAAKELAVATGADMDATRTWKLADGVFTQISTNQIVAYAIAIGEHWQSCFDREAALSAPILAATDLPSLQAIDITTGWPA